MKKTLFGITLAAFENIWVLGCAIIVIIGLWFYYHNYQKNIIKLVVKQWQKLMIPAYFHYKFIIKAIVFAVGILFLAFALLRPQWGQKEEVIQQEGRELFIGLDISRSMLATDIKPTRLTFAKTKIKKLVQMLSADRVGLLVFASDAIVQCPLTRDTAAFNLFLDSIDVETISAGSTALDQALSKIVGLFADMPTRKNKLAVLFTDGEDFSSNLSLIKEQARQQGVHIFTYGVGTEQGAPVPLINDTGQIIGHQKDQQGNVVFSRLNQGILQALSRESGGIYIAPTQQNEDLESLVAHVERYEKEKFDDKQMHTQEERYPYFLGISFFCFLIEWLL